MGKPLIYAERTLCTATCSALPIRYPTRGAAAKSRGWERLRDHDVQRYAKLRADHEHIHAPDEMAIAIVDLDVERSEISGIADLSDLELCASSRAALQNELSVVRFFPRMARRI